MEKYLINENTLVLIPYKGGTKVIENYICYEINKNPFEIIDESCKFYGSSFHGRVDSTEYLTGIRYKCPIMISEKKRLIFFPTLSHKNEKCVWFNHNSIKKYYKNNSKLLEIILSNNKKITINLSNNVFSNQIFKSSRLESVLRSKKH